MILYQLKQGGSGDFGISRTLSVLSCPLRSQFDLDAQKRGGKTSFDNIGAVRIGTLGHAFMELYGKHPDLNPRDVEFYSKVGGVKKNWVWPWGEPIDRKELRDAQLLFDAYKLICGRDLYTKGCKIEQTISGTEVSEAVGIPGFTMKVDLIARIGRNKIHGVEPGIYLVDHKFISGRGRWRDEYMRRDQFIAYRIGAEAAGIKCRGLVVNCVLKTKPVDVVRLVLGRVTSVERKQLRQQLQLARILKRWGGPNKASCYGCYYTDVCKRLK